MKLELISFPICPFVQRAVITLRHKQVAFDITYIELANPPGWFVDLSPFRKVPVLRVDGKHVIFESAVIDEYLDEITPGALLPADALPRAIDRSWIEFGTACLLEFSAMIHASEERIFEASRQALQHKIAWLEKALEEGPFFNGDDISLVDFAYAPLFTRCRELKLESEIYPASVAPRTAAWAARLNALPVVQHSVPDGFPVLLRDHIRAKAPIAAQKLAL